MSDLATSFCVSFEKAGKSFFYLLSLSSHHNIFYIIISFHPSTNKKNCLAREKVIIKVAIKAVKNCNNEIGK